MALWISERGCGWKLSGVRAKSFTQYCVSFQNYSLTTETSVILNKVFPINVSSWTDVFLKATLLLRLNLNTEIIHQNKICGDRVDRKAFAIWTIAPHGQTCPWISCPCVWEENCWTHTRQPSFYCGDRGITVRRMTWWAHRGGWRAGCWLDWL